MRLISAMRFSGNELAIFYSTEEERTSVYNSTVKKSAEAMCSLFYTKQQIICKGL